MPDSLTNSDGVPTDYRTVDRYNFPFDERILALEADSRLAGKFSAGDVTQNVLIGLDFRHYADDAEYGFAVAPPIDLFDPTYGVPITTPPLSSPYLQQIQKQIGLYAEDVVKLSKWVLTAGGREDNLDMSNFGTQTTNHKFTYHVGLNYLFQDGLAPYLSYATSFQPTSGANFAGTAFQPTSGNQVEAGLKFQPASVPSGVHLFTTLSAYDLKQNNVLTPDPVHTLFEVQSGQVEVKGLELESVMRVGAHWSFNAAITTMNPVVTKSNGPDLDKQLPATPKDMASALAGTIRCSWAFSLISARVWASVTSGPATAIRRIRSRLPGATLWDSTVHYTYRDHWLMDLSMSNMLNKTYVAQCSSLTACYYGDKRVVNLTVTRGFQAMERSHGLHS